ncbi:MAG: 6-phosphogluconolactonase [Thermodesulfobacteriota bacterium]|nr:6-phosphogluconolactonase [Thermodesulfobacteriota bacterium]
MTDPINFHSFSDQDTLTSELATTITALLSDGIAQNGRASLAVSGGSTPVKLFERLSHIDLPWQHVDILLVDERWVAPDDPDSNEHLVSTHLLQNMAAVASFTGMKNSAVTASEGEAECARQLQKIHRPFDVLILGMGGDGHTASLFPGAVKLARATDMNSGKICMGIAPVTAPHERMTLTLPAILDSKHIFLHITGQNKKDVLQQALAHGPAEEMPIRFILQHHAQEQKSNFSIYWAQ